MDALNIVMAAKVAVETTSKAAWAKLDRIQAYLDPESVPHSRFTDPAYLKAEHAVARVERSIRRNVR